MSDSGFANKKQSKEPGDISMPVPPPPSAYNTQKKSVYVQFKNWEDFQIMASKAQQLAFSYRESDKYIEVDATVNGKILVYVGPAPSVEKMLGFWISRQLNVSPDKIIKGSIQQKL